MRGIADGLQRRGGAAWRAKQSTARFVRATPFSAIYARVRRIWLSGVAQAEHIFYSLVRVVNNTRLQPPTTCKRLDTFIPSLYLFLFFSQLPPSSFYLPMFFF